MTGCAWTVHTTQFQISVYMCLCTYSGINLNLICHLFCIFKWYTYIQVLLKLLHNYLTPDFLKMFSGQLLIAVCLSKSRQSVSAEGVSPYSNQITAGLRKQIHSILALIHSALFPFSSFLALFPSPYKSQIGTNTVMPQAHVTCRHGTLQNSY